MYYGLLGILSLSACLAQPPYVAHRYSTPGRISMCSCRSRAILFLNILILLHNVVLYIAFIMMFNVVDLHVVAMFTWSYGPRYSRLFSILTDT